MNRVTDKELMSINGGGITIGAVVGICAAIVFIVGVIDGFVNPEKCN